MLKKIIKSIIKTIADTIEEAHDQMCEEIDETEEPTGKQVVILNPAGEGSDIDLRVVGLFSSVTEEKIAEVITGLIYLNETGKKQKEEKKEQKDIEFYISTYGGSSDDMFALYDVMKQIETESPIATFGIGKVMSAGVLLLAAGTKGKRKIGKNCRVMIHSVAAGNQGELKTMINELEEIKNIQNMYIKALVSESNLTEGQLRDMLDKGVNVYLTAEETVKYGIADIIV